MSCLARMEGFQKAIPKKLLEIDGLRVRNSAELVHASVPNLNAGYVYITHALLPLSSCKVASLNAHVQHLDDIVDDTKKKLENESPNVDTWQAYLDLHHGFMMTLEADIRDAQRRINGQKAKDKKQKTVAAENNGPDDEDEAEDDDIDDDEQD